MFLTLTISSGKIRHLQPGVASATQYLLRTGQTLLIGRSASQADIVLADDPTLSGVHFQITCQPGGAALQDLASRHGTLVNGEKVAQAELKDGDLIDAGETRFEVHLFAAPDQASRPRTASDAMYAAGASQSLAEIARRDRSYTKPASRMRVRVQIIEESGSSMAYQPGGRLFTWLLSEESATFGRSPERADVPLPRDPQMSSAHFRMSCDGQNCRLRDLKSTNGTRLNGQRISSARLRDGDEIEAGRTRFIVHITGGVVAAEDQSRRSVVAVPTPQPGIPPEAVTEGYRIVNLTPFPLAPLTGRVNYPGHSLTLIVKGTFTLHPGEVATLADEQQFPTGDMPFPGGDASSDPPKYESDFAFFKPRADVLLVGHCHSPNGQPVRRLKPAMRVGELTRSLEVFGERVWKWERNTWQVGEPKAFTSQELRYNFSWGGTDCDANPVGFGFHKSNPAPADPPQPIPHIEDSKSLMRSPADVVEPAGFGPLGKWYGRRKKQLGTYDQNWQKKRWPWFPQDFNWDHYNAAPVAQQIQGYLKGDEPLSLSYLHPEHSDYRSRLPGIRVRVFLNPRGKEFHEVPMLLDTLWLDADSERAVLVWRGHSAVASEDCEDIRHILILSQPMTDTPWTVAECHALLLDELARRDNEFNPPPETAATDAVDATTETVETHETDIAAESVVESTPADAAETAAAEAKRKFEDELSLLQSRVRESQIAAGVAPEMFDRQVQAEQARLFREWGFDGDSPPADLAERVASELSRIQRQVYDAQVVAGLNPAPLPEPVAPKKADIPENSGAWSRQRVIAHHAAGGTFAGEDLSNLPLSDLILSGADFRTAILKGTQLCRCTLHGCRFELASLANCDLTESDLTGSSMDHADLSKAILIRTKLVRAHAHGTIFAEANLTDASLHQADARGSYLTAALLINADLTSACFDNADFARADLQNARLQRSSLIEASMQEASAAQAGLEHANLTRLRAAGSAFRGACFREAVLSDSIWEKAKLDSADFSYAQLPGANLTKASLENAKLFAANLTGSRLNRANLRGAMMTDSNLFEANVQQADFTKADLSRSNLYGAEVLGAVWAESRREGVNWRMTKIADEEQAS